MRLFISLLFLTLVLTCRITSAAPQTEMEPKTIENPIKVNEKDLPQNPEKTEPTRLSHPPGSILEVQPNMNPIVSEPKSPNDVQLSYGLLYGQVKTSADLVQTQYFGFSWTHDEKENSAWGIQLDLTSIQTLGAGIYKRLYIDDTEIGMSPYAKYGLVDYFEPTEFLGTFINTSRIKFTAAMGLNDVIDRNKHWNVEFGTGLGTIGALFYLQFGYYQNF